MREHSIASRRGRAFLFGLGLGIGMCLGATLPRSNIGRHRVPHMKIWQRVLVEKYGEVEGTILTERVQEHFEKLYAERPRFTQPALRWHLETNILPGLALYQVLSEKHGKGKAALEETGAMLPTKPDKLYPFLRYLPDPFAFFKGAGAWLLRLAYPHEGWGITIREDSDRSFAFDIHRCFYLDIFTVYGVPELTAAYCALDDRAFVNLPSSIKWERTKTLGRGDDCCDFRWSRGEQEQDGARLIQILPGKKSAASSEPLTSKSTR